MTAKQKHPDLFPILMVCFGYFSYSVMDALSKWLIGDIPIAQITMTINAISAILLLSIILIKQGPKGLKVNQPKLHLLRVLFFLPVPYFVLKALDILPLTEFYSVAFTAPLVIMGLSILFLKEHFEKAKMVMAIIGLVGVYIVIQGQFAQNWTGFLYTLLAVIGMAGNTITLRKIRNGSSQLTFSLYPALAFALVYGGFALTSYVTPTPYQWIILLATGLAVFGGQVGCVMGFTKASSTSTVAPYHYTQMIWGIILGYIIFEHIPSTSALIGTVLIIYSGLYIALFTQSKQQAQKS